MLDFDELEEIEGRVYKPVVLQEEIFLSDKGHAVGKTIDQLLWQGDADVARVVTLFGPGVVVLPLLGKVCGVDEASWLAYKSHESAGLISRAALEEKFGKVDPRQLVEELLGGTMGLEERMSKMTDDELEAELKALNQWHSAASNRMKTLEKRVAWGFLGMPADGTGEVPSKVASEETPRKAFKRKALELHPDKGGDAQRFQLLQDMKEILVEFVSEENNEEAGADGKDDQDDKRDQKEWARLKKFLRKRVEDGSTEKTDLSKIAGLGRKVLEGARRKMHQTFHEMWKRSGQLAAEAKMGQGPANSKAVLGQLRSFLNQFADREIRRRKRISPKEANKVFDRFLAEGSEVLCAACAVDPVGTMSQVTMRAPLVCFLWSSSSPTLSNQQGNRRRMFVE